MPRKSASHHIAGSFLSYAGKPPETHCAQTEAPLRRRELSHMATVHGQVAAGFEEVRREFERNFVERGEIGAAVAAFWHGDKVVDLWGGSRTPGGGEPWTENTMVVVMSITKGIAAMTLAVAAARG